MKGEVMRGRTCVLLMVAALACGGCAGPVVTVRHLLPPDLPLPDGPKLVRLAEFTVVSGPRDSYGQQVAAELSERLRPMGEYAVVEEFPAEDLNWARLAIRADIHVDAEDTQGTRIIRRIDPTMQTGQTETVQTLVRDVDVRVDFVVTDARTGEQAAAAEAR